VRYDRIYRGDHKGRPYGTHPGLQFNRCQGESVGATLVVAPVYAFMVPAVIGDPANNGPKGKHNCQALTA